MSIKSKRLLQLQECICMCIQTYLNGRSQHDIQIYPTGHLFPGFTVRLNKKYQVAKVSEQTSCVSILAGVDKRSISEAFRGGS